MIKKLYFAFFIVLMLSNCTNDTNNNWSYSIDSNTSSPKILTNNEKYIVLQNGNNLRAINIKDGKGLWASDISGSLTSSTIKDNYLYFNYIEHLDKVMIQNCATEQSISEDFVFAEYSPIIKNKSILLIGKRNNMKSVFEFDLNLKLLNEFSFEEEIRTDIIYFDTKNVIYQQQDTLFMFNYLDNRHFKLLENEDVMSKFKVFASADLSYYISQSLDEQTRLYKLEDSIVKFVTIPEEYCKRIEIKNEKLILIYDNRFIVSDLNSGTEIWKNSITTNVKTIYASDKYICTEEENFRFGKLILKVRIFDITTGNIVKNINLNSKIIDRVISHNNLIYTTVFELVSTPIQK